MKYFAGLLALVVIPLTAWGGDPSSNTAATSRQSFLIAGQYFSPDEDSIGGTVSRATFTSAVVNREPVDRVVELTNDQRHIYFFTELKGLAGEVISHTWEYAGKIVARETFEVGGPRWRTWSSKTLLPEWTGKWKVVVRDLAGQIISETTFNYLNSGS
jgi:hypothetical protein